MRILFYLPVVTPWWFDNIVGRLIRLLADEAEVHVMVPPLWRGTGIGPDQVAALADREDVVWHILDGDDHPQLRTSAASCPELLELVRAIAPDICLCRSADLETLRALPGVVRHIMEGGFPPFPSQGEWVVLRDDPFDHGVMPALGAADRAALLAAFDPAWQSLRHQLPGYGAARAAVREAAGLPHDRAILALPLEYEHEENFFAGDGPFARGADLVRILAETLGDDVLLAVTDHPLNTLHCDRTQLESVVAELDGRVQLVRAGEPFENPTVDVALACDGMILGNSKAITVAAFCGAPILRISDHPTGDWLNAERHCDAFLRAVRAGQGRVASEAEARAWFAFHVANHVIQPHHPDTDGRLILDMIETPVDPRRWQAGLGRYAETYPELFQ